MSNQDHAHAANTIIAFFSEKLEKSAGGQDALIALQRKIIDKAGALEYIQWADYGSHDLSYLEAFSTPEQRIAFLKSHRFEIEIFVQEAQDNYAHYLIGAIHTKKFNEEFAAVVVNKAIAPNQDNTELMDSVMSDIIERTKYELLRYLSL